MRTDQINVGGNEANQQSSYISPGAKVQLRPAGSGAAARLVLTAALPPPEVGVEVAIQQPKERKRRRR